MTDFPKSRLESWQHYADDDYIDQPVPRCEICGRVLDGDDESRCDECLPHEFDERLEEDQL